MTLIQQPGNGLPDNLPLLTQVADEDAPDDLPTLTEVVVAEIVAEEQAETAATFQSAAETPLPAARALSEEEMRHLLQRLETHLENRFALKLNLKLAQLQRQAVEQAVNELKTELPELLRDALKPHPGL